MSRFSPSSARPSPGAAPEPPRLTARQQQILDWIRAHIDVHGMPPTRAEIAKGLGFSTPSSAVRRLVPRGGFIGNRIQDRRVHGFQGGRKACQSGAQGTLIKVEVVVPEEYMGEVIGNLNSRRGRIESMDSRPGTQIIRAMVPLAEMFGYATDLRSLTQGRAIYTMHFSQYDEIPKALSDEIVARGRARLVSK